MIGLLLTWIAGFEGIPIPYSPKLDDGITVLLLCCFSCQPMYCPAVASSWCSW